MISAVAQAASRLESAGIAPETLGTYQPEARRFGIGRRERITPAGEAWRLGALLLLPSGRAAGIGEVIVAQEERRRGFTAESARRRAELGEAAVRGGIAPGRTVHLGWRVIDPAHAVVTWSAGAPPIPILDYLRERLETVLG
ncbi:hypothetical protein ATL40_2449 [Serinibacter salmoneus]|uniref:Glutaminase n=1 Tax=Serinibacter salmoneus TaxID=556530 RepID=A0A2A9D2D6_9MICO|nr:hypothetical protein ATL40_2449 [Serinibacter salmoneus]